MTKQPENSSDLNINDLSILDITVRSMELCGRTNDEVDVLIEAVQAVQAAFHIFDARNSNCSL